jgi:hypothetical protein
VDRERHAKETSMIPRQEEFFLDVRSAVRFQQRPIVTANSGLVDPDPISRILERAAFWLTPKVVARYDPQDFTSLPADQQVELCSAVDEFRALAASVSPCTNLTNAEFNRGLESFQRLVSAVRRIVLEEWTRAACSLINQADEWAQGFGWRTRRVEKNLTETLLGPYTLPQMQLYAEQHLHVLDPVGRFVPGATGAFDLSIQPSFELTNLYRDYGRVWYVHLDVGQGVNGARHEAWSVDTFRKSVDELRSLYDATTAAH